MLRYRLNTIKVGEAWYLPLPKLNTGQMSLLARRLTDTGFKLEIQESLFAKRGVTIIRINPSGLCRSNADPTDVIAPAVPAMLDVAPEKIRLDQVRDSYFRIQRKRPGAVVRFTTRMESSVLWSVLRENGACGLSPDEREAILSLVAASSGTFKLITDFPNEGAVVKMLGGRQYFESELTAKEVNSTLRMLGEKQTKNSYLPKSGVMHFESLRLPSPSEQKVFFGTLGEWCYLRPK